MPAPRTWTSPRIGEQIRYARDRWLYRRGVALADRIVAQNEVQRSSCRATYGRDAVVIPSCYQRPERRDGNLPRKDTVIWVGVIRPGKRPQLLLELARRLPQRRFVMVGGPRGGDAALFERTRAEAATLPNVEFTGFLPLAEVESRFDAARLLVNTSDYEGLPNTFLQAWARGVPTLGTVDAGTSAHRRFGDVEAGARESKRCSPIRNAGRTPPSAAASTSSATTREARRSRTTAGFSKGSPHERGLGGVSFARLKRARSRSAR